MPASLYSGLGMKVTVRPRFLATILTTYLIHMVISPMLVKVSSKISISDCPGPPAS